MTNLVQKLTDDGMMYVDWNVSSGDASGKRLTPAQIAANVRGGLKHGRGNIVLMHDTSAKKTTADAVQSMIDGAKADGYAFYPITADTVPVLRAYGTENSRNLLFSESDSRMRFTGVL